MGKGRTSFLVRALLAAVLAAMALADEPQDNQSMRPVDLKKDGFDIILQALPSGELFLPFAMPEDAPVEGHCIDFALLCIAIPSHCHYPKAV